MQESLLIQGLHIKFDLTKAEDTSPATPNLSMPLQTTMSLHPTTLSEDLKDIQPRKSHVSNFYEI